MKEPKKLLNFIATSGKHQFSVVSQKAGRSLIYLVRNLLCSCSRQCSSVSSRNNGSTQLANVVLATLTRLIFFCGLFSSSEPRYSGLDGVLDFRRRKENHDLRLRGVASEPVDQPCLRKSLLSPLVLRFDQLQLEGASDATVPKSYSLAQLSIYFSQNSI